MSATLRAFYGALIGALAVLLAHPYSRPYLFTGVWFFDNSSFLEETQFLNENLETLPEPRSLESAAVWAHTAAQRDLSAKPLTRDEALLVVEVLQAAAERDPDNAFWWQIQAVFLWDLGSEEASISAWRTGALASRWSDVQNNRLNSVVSGLAGEAGRNMGWHYAMAMSRKSPLTCHLVLGFARRLMRGDRATDLELRIATLRNGRLMRDGNRSVEGASLGEELVELAAYCVNSDYAGFAGVGRPINPRVLSTSRDGLIAAVQADSPEIETEIREAFQENDARNAMLDDAEIGSHVRLLSFASVLAASLPGALISIGILGAAIYLVGMAFARSKALQSFLSPPWNHVAGIVAGLLVFVSTRLFFPSLWAAVSLGSFGVRRDDERQGLPKGLGPAYGATIVFLGVAFSLLLAIYLVSISSPGQYVLEPAGVTSGPILERFTLISLSVVVASLALVTASVWGFLSRIPAQRLAGPSIVKFGATVCLGCFATGVVLVPVAIAIDRPVTEALMRIYQNEPTFYLMQ